MLDDSTYCPKIPTYVDYNNIQEEISFSFKFTDRNTDRDIDIIGTSLSGEKGGGGLTMTQKSQRVWEKIWWKLYQYTQV